MFDKALVRRLATNSEIDVGQLAETLLFYQDIQLILDAGSISALAKKIGSESISRLITEKYVSPTYFPDFFGSSRQTMNGVPIHTLVQFRQTGSVGDKEQWDCERALRSAFERSGFDLDIAKSDARKFSRLIPEEKLRLSNKPIEIIKMAQQDLADQQYVQQAARLVIADMVPGFQIPDNWRFVVHETNGGQIVETNYNFELINQRYGKPPEIDVIT